MCTIDPKQNNIEQLKSIVRMQTLRGKLESNGFGHSSKNVIAYEIITDRTEMAKDRPATGDEFYYYSGPVSDDTRDFCRYMLRVDKVFSRAEIDFMSRMMGYNVFEYVPGPIMPNGGPGGPNCKHRWIRFRGKFISTPAPTDSQITSLINKNIFDN